MNKAKLVVVVPVYNESDIIEETIEGLKKIKYIDEIVVVNDGSTDDTLKIIDKLNVSVINLSKNYGKGYAMRKAIETLEYDYIGFIDGDLGNTSMQTEFLILPVINNEADLSIAEFPKASIKGGFGILKSFAIKGVYYFTKQEVKACLSGQRVYRKGLIDQIDYIPNGYGIEVAMTIQAINKGFSIIEIPLTMKHRYSGRNFKGFLHRGKQFFNILKTFVIMYFRR